ncbi:MAG: ThiF family adenylyltransferase [Clostridia bacterium]|nr:ThiF family adenylyltransferase [Clostridia bacterium]
MNEFLSRFSLMIGEEKINKLISKKVILFGVGGVGGAVAEMLVRSGVSNITIVDFDKVDISNINRQAVATISTIGKNKVDAMKEKLLDINNLLNIQIINNKLTQENIDSFHLSTFDYVIDCIDDVKAKKQLIKHCYSSNITILVSCGAGNRYKEIPAFQVADIHKTEYDPLAKIIRKFCVQEGIKKLNVVYTKQPAEKLDSTTIGSVVYYPTAMACVIACKVINDMIK